jgi:hypothetical protein
LRLQPNHAEARSRLTKLQETTSTSMNAIQYH